MNKILLAAWIALSIFWTGVAVQAQEHHAQHGGEQPQASARAAPTGSHAEMWAQLTQEQQKSLQDLQQNAFRQTYPLVLQLRAKRAQLVAALAQENVDTDAVNQLVDEMNQIRTSIDQQRVDMVLRIKDMGLPQEMFGKMLMTHGMKGLMSPGM
ncbi:MAG: periplasmic heavy metal sensor, partial [Desulfovibrionales bacterium]